MTHFREKKQIVICAIAVAMVMSFVLLQYLPLQKKRKALEKAKASQTIALAKVSVQKNQLPKLKTQLLEMQNIVENYHKNIPEQRDLGTFLHKIASLMNTQNLTEQVVQPGDEIEAGELNCIPVNMQCKGKMEQVFEFYKQLRQLDRLIRIEQVVLDNGNDFSGLISMQTKAVIYYRPQPKQG